MRGTRWPWLFSIAMVTLALAARYVRIDHDLPYYSIDENDIVEAAVAFLAGDQDPHWYKYGPLLAYLLSGIFGAMQEFGSWFANWHEFYSAAIFNASPFYLSARILHSAITLVACAVGVIYARRNFGIEAAWTALWLGCMPLLEAITDFTIRVDSLQGLWALTALYFASCFDEHPHSGRHYVVAGICAGLGLATKPIPGLLLLPALIYAHLSSPGARDYRLLVLMVTGLLAAHAVAHPYSILNMGAFFSEQIEVLTTKSAQGGTMAGWDFSWLVRSWGLPLALTAGTAVLLGGWHDRGTRILTVYVLTFALLLSLFQVRDYWYNSILPTLLVLTARLVSTITSRYAGKRALLTAAALITGLTWFPLHEVFIQPHTARADRRAQEWIEANIPSGSRIFAIGWYAINLPRLVSSDAFKQSGWGEHFMYGRDQNQPWIEQFSTAHQRYLASGEPHYDIVNFRLHYRGDPAYARQPIFGSPLLDVFHHSLDGAARKMGCQYIVTAGSSHFTGEWENAPGVERLAQFQDTRNEVKIFRLAPDGN